MYPVNTAQNKSSEINKIYLLQLYIYCLLYKHGQLLMKEFVMAVHKCLKNVKFFTSFFISQIFLFLSINKKNKQDTNYTLAPNSDIPIDT